MKDLSKMVMSEGVDDEQDSISDCPNADYTTFIIEIKP